MTSLKIQVEKERQRIIKKLKEKGISQNEKGEKVDDLPLLTLAILSGEIKVKGI